MDVALPVIVLVLVGVLMSVRATRWGKAARDRAEGKPRKPIMPGTWVVFGIVIALALTNLIGQAAIN